RHLVAQDAGLSKLRDRRANLPGMSGAKERPDLRRDPRGVAGLIRFDHDRVEVRNAERILKRGERYERGLRLIRIRWLDDTDDVELLTANDDLAADRIDTSVEELIR